jgi:hypothetical protein
VRSGTRIALEDACHDKIRKYYACFLREQLFFREQVIVFREEVIVFREEVIVFAVN